jgi:hypothetical protein
VPGTGKRPGCSWCDPMIVVCVVRRVNVVTRELPCPAVVVSEKD